MYLTVYDTVVKFVAITLCILAANTIFQLVTTYMFRQWYPAYIHQDV
jgi:hypothetical protein